MLPLKFVMLTFSSVCSCQLCLPIIYQHAENPELTTAYNCTLTVSYIFTEALRFQTMTYNSINEQLFVLISVIVRSTLVSMLCNYCHLYINYTAVMETSK